MENSSTFRDGAAFSDPVIHSSFYTWVVVAYRVVSYITSCSFTTVRDLGIIIPIPDWELKQMPEDAQLRSNRIMT